MFRALWSLLAVVVLVVPNVRADDKEVSGTVVRVDEKESQIVIKTDDGEKTYDVNEAAKFIGPKGGISEARLKDDRLVKGAVVKILVAGNNRTAREIHLPVRGKKEN